MINADFNESPTTNNLLFGVFVRCEQVNGLHMTEINIMTQQKYEQQFADVLLLLVTIQRFFA